MPEAITASIPSYYKFDTSIKHGSNEHAVGDWPCCHLNISKQPIGISLNPLIMWCAGSATTGSSCGRGS